MKIFWEKPAIPRKKRSPRVGMFREERMVGESPLELLASVASKCWELNARLPLEKKKRKIKSFLSTEENRKKTSLNLMENEATATAAKKERDDNSLSVAYKLWEMSEKLPSKKMKREFSSPVAEIQKSNKRKKTRDSKARKENPPEKTTTTEKKPEKDIPMPAIEEVLPMPAAMAEKIRRMGGERVKLLIQKRLHQSDINAANSRLSIPCNQKRTDFLSESEETILREHVPNTKTMRGIQVLVIDPRLEEMVLSLKRWKMKTTFVYNLIGNWNSLVEENNLEVGDAVQLWVFRMKERIERGFSDLCFALVKLEEDNNGRDDEDTVSRSSTVSSSEN